MTVLPVFVKASRALMPEVPAIFKVAFAPCVNPPVPEIAVEAVIVPLFVSNAGLVTVRRELKVSIPLLV